ncbi:hypothetical protein HID58_086536 [Brassica napus]|uniref:Uncharacterized protein n=1 Tax=Brassica napus TaxID=3708 RepID=A0ABQ7XQM0_BRANA|nr:hypothetical protein HID58_086536 [Brassica napus]
MTQPVLNYPDGGALSTELRKLRTNMHGYGMGPGSEWSTENWPRSPGELARVAAELAGRAGSCHGQARRASWLVSRPCSPGELARVTAELAVDSTGNTATELRKLWTKMHGYGMGPGSEWSTENWPRSPGNLARVAAELARRTGPCHGRARRRLDRQHGRARRASWLVSRPSSPGDPFRLFVFSAFEVLTEIQFF